ncbi:MAG: ATP-binding protein [Panacagrimonas sp.]
MVRSDMVERTRWADTIRRSLRRSRVVALVGPRQCGKTTLARSFVELHSANYFDLEDPVSLARLAEPMTALRGLRGTVVIDEIQRRPDLFPVLRVLADRKPLPARFLILGSASPELLRQTSETLAGRVETIELMGFSLDELSSDKLSRHWLRGGFPLSYLARSESDSLAWRTQFIRTFIERDLRQMGVQIPPAALLRFLNMLAHYHGQVWNAAEPARSLGVSEPTVRRYLDLLSGLFLARQLPPWHENLGKRQVKAPKVYVRDSGLLHQLLGLQTHAQLLNHPKSGASWEGYALEQVLHAAQADASYFWATHNGAELDLLLLHKSRRYGVEFKRADAPTLSRSMQIALDDLGLERLTVIYPGEMRYSLADRVEVIPLSSINESGANLIYGRA